MKESKRIKLLRYLYDKHKITQSLDRPEDIQEEEWKDFFEWGDDLDVFSLYLNNLFLKKGVCSVLESLEKLEKQDKKSNHRWIFGTTLAVVTILVSVAALVIACYAII